MDQSEQACLLAQAQDPNTTEVDYIVVGAGPGGGPLAARLALAGHTVLLIDSGGDPMAINDMVVRVPGYNARSTEEPALSWMFSVRHYPTFAQQALDTKHTSRLEPHLVSGAPFPARLRDDPTGNPGGIFYPRSSGLGGCTAHNAMILVTPNDHDWNRIADLTGDDSWRPGAMRGYFAKLERCQYIDGRFETNLVSALAGRAVNRLYRIWRFLSLLVDPRAILDRGGHGVDGWQPTSYVAPAQLLRRSWRDRRLLLGFIFAILRHLRPEGSTLTTWVRSLLFRGSIVQRVDLNDVNTRRASPEGLFLVPLAVQRGERTGLREWLFETAGTSRAKLILQTHFHVERILFDWNDATSTPRAIGVLGSAGNHLYQASPNFDELVTGQQRSFFVRREVIVCGGAFNTPQLLMLSGIGPRAGRPDGIKLRDAADKPLVVRAEELGTIDLPGVGENLQDRYEVSVISELKRDLDILKTVTLDPDDVEGDCALREWKTDRDGVYASNGAILGVLRRSPQVPRDQPADVFMLAVPVAFRGYYWGWSQELLGGPGTQGKHHNLWSWVILKAYTANNAGTVRLRSADAFEAPTIQFNSFSPSGEPANDNDLAALEDAVEFVRRVNRSAGTQKELEPGAGLKDSALRTWIQAQSWGHHACGTCRMGADVWTAQPHELLDEKAVVDSQFRVHGVDNLRIVDASVFPFTPGYFPVAAVFMISEKAADAMLFAREQITYPDRLELGERVLIDQRRRAARVADRPWRLGLALSGGGVRSATFGLGVLQALAALGKLREVDYLSTVSGGGFTGAFLGGLFTRDVVTSTADPAGRVEQLVQDSSSAPMAWLRAQADYVIGTAGITDILQLVSIYWRNALAVYLILGTLGLGAMGLLAQIGAWLADVAPVRHVARIALSPWWPLPLALFGGLVLPLSLGYWLIPAPGSRASYAGFGSLAFGVGVVVATAALTSPFIAAYGLGALLVLGLAWLFQEFSRVAAGSSTAHSSRPRNRLTRALGSTLWVLGVCLWWVIVDTLARAVLERGWHWVVGGLVAAGASLQPLPFLMQLLNRKEGARARRSSADARLSAMAAVFVIPGLLLLAVALDLAALKMAQDNGTASLVATLLALLFSAALGPEMDFLNLSSLHRTYAVRLQRTFLGASNPARVYMQEPSQAQNVDLEMPDDDIMFHDYHPECSGGPLHLVNVCVNETVDMASDRDVRDRKGLSMCLGPAGVSVGRRFHALWDEPPAEAPARRYRSAQQGRKAALRPIGNSPDPNAFHVFGRRESSVTVEALSLGEWAAISGAAFTTGLGYQTKPLLSLFLGLINFRLGYWWNSGLDAHERPGRYPYGLLQRIKRWPSTLFKQQCRLLNEWQGRFDGPSQRHWYLSDGGHFDVTGLYELLRRRTDFMICVDAGHDNQYAWEDVGRLVRLARADFGAEITWLEPQPQVNQVDPWTAVQAAVPNGEQIPAWVRDHIHPQALGELTSIRNGSSARAALAYVRYANPDASGYILLIKPATNPSDPVDVSSYARVNEDFPQQSTLDQAFEDSQWESYRALGRHIGTEVLR